MRGGHRSYGSQRRPFTSQVYDLRVGIQQAQDLDVELDSPLVLDRPGKSEGSSSRDARLCAIRVNQLGGRYNRHRRPPRAMVEPILHAHPLIFYIPADLMSALNLGSSPKSLNREP